MTTINVFAYIWQENLAAKHTHSSIQKLQEPSDFLQNYMPQSNKFHAGMVVFPAKFKPLKVSLHFGVSL
jgi:hypothetical protein